MEQHLPEEYQPPLRTWQHVWRLLLCAAISALVWVPVMERQLAWHPALLWLDVVLGLASFVLVLGRRRWPFSVAMLTAVLSAVSGLAAGPATLAAVSLATRRQGGQIAAVGVVSLLAAEIWTLTQDHDGISPLWLGLVLNVTVVGAALGWGMYIGSRRELLWTLQRRAERAEAEQELRVGQARGTERARIAREMHDVLAHRISQVSMHAGALAFREDLGADQMREGAAQIQQTANRALDDLRSVLGVLRGHESAAELDRPQPTYAAVAALVEEARAGGIRIDLEDDLTGSPDDVPETAGRTVYRIVQEGITNAAKHAPGTLVHIRLAGSPDQGLRVELRNPLGFASTAPRGAAPGATPGSGLGLIGLEERAELRGGRLEHRREGDTFLLRGWIPWAS
ncbi:sensor histidine kinase [Nocardioides pacificus]